ncbi:Hypothetical predicted protein [Mytilus galloprovincialis]|uniref:Uncharacterized protein n=1 Tax=Mytilus galloprovincialis TaxID=29158 RepID=A0A8B6FMV7_MYTGA|nr:Hypothetical predicted protein [Mytilus galloprovincialis]
MSRSRRTKNSSILNCDTSNRYQALSDLENSPYAEQENIISKSKKSANHKILLMGNSHVFEFKADLSDHCQGSTMLRVNCNFNAVQIDVHSIPNQYIWEEHSAEKFQNALASPLNQEKRKKEHLITQTLLVTQILCYTI